MLLGCWHYQDKIFPKKFGQKILEMEMYLHNQASKNNQIGIGLA